MLNDLRIWIAGAIVISLVLPVLDIPSSWLIILVLIIQMTLSLHGLNVTVKDFLDNKHGAFISVILCFLVNTAVTLLIGLPFIETNPAIWYGWVMLASMPCAISVVTAAILKMADVKNSLVAVSGTYVAGLVLTPVLTYVLIGDAVNPLEILKYILLFIIIPVLLSRPLSRIKMERGTKVPIINLMMALMVFLSINNNKEFIFSFPDIIALVFLVSIIRLAILHYSGKFLSKRLGIDEKNVVVYQILTVWKNTGLSVSMCMVILGTAFPEAVLPCVVCMCVETVWFSIITMAKDEK